MFEMRPQILDGAGVTSALSEVAADGPWSTLELDIDLPRQSTTTDTIVYRCVRELIVNARKHSRASRLSIRGRQAGDTIVFDVDDDGVGFDVQGALDRERSRMHLGLDTTIERARLAGGSLAIDSAPGQGARMRLTLPADPFAV